MKSKLFRLITNGLNRNSHELDTRVEKMVKAHLMENNLGFFNTKDDLVYSLAIDADKYRRRNNKTVSWSGDYTPKPRNKPRFRNICLVTGRTRSVIRYFKLSRIHLKRAAKLRLVTGLRLSSW